MTGAELVKEFVLDVYGYRRGFVFDDIVVRRLFAIVG